MAISATLGMQHDPRYWDQQQAQYEMMRQQSSQLDAMYMAEKARQQASPRVVPSTPAVDKTLLLLEE
jgi:hypothetical protein